MKPADGKVRFVEWLPDLDDLDNPGLLEAENTLYLDGGFRPFKPLSTLSGMSTLTSEPLGGIVTELYTYVGLSTSLRRSLTTLGTWTDYSRATAYATSTAWAFERFDDLILATNYEDTPQRQTLGSVSDFANITAAPNARVIGKVGQFIILGDTNDGVNGAVPYRVQWSAIGDPTSWPTPGTSTARAVQAGAELLNPEWGPVKAIVGGDQYGILMQRGGLTRVTYVGGTSVFQFDEYSNYGCAFPFAVVRAGTLWYYISYAGFMATDGVSVLPIGAGKVDRYFWDTYIKPNDNRIRAGVDVNRKMIFWAYPQESGNNATHIIAYNYEAKKFTLAEQDCNCLLSDPEAIPSANLSFRAFDTSHVGRRFTGNEGVAVFTTGEAEFTQGGRTHVQGIKPLVSWPTGITPNETVALGTRNDQDADSLSFTAESTPNTRTRFAGFRSDARYHRARITLTGAFDQAHGFELQAAPAGST